MAMKLKFCGVLLTRGVARVECRPSDGRLPFIYPRARFWASARPFAGATSALRVYAGSARRSLSISHLPRLETVGKVSGEESHSNGGGGSTCGKR